MKYSFLVFDLKNLIIYSDLKKNMNFFLNIKTIIGFFLYNLKFLNFLYLKENYNKFYFKFRFLHFNLLILQKFLLNFKNGFFAELLLIGLGFKILRSKKLHKLFFELHFSHKIIYNIPSYIYIKCGKKKLLVFGLNKQYVYDIANEIKSLRIPNIYKGKGIRFLSETIKLKPGKQR